VLVFKFKKKGIARLKLVPEAYFRKQYLLFYDVFRIPFLEILKDIDPILQLNASFSDFKIRSVMLTQQIIFILM